MHGTSSLRLSAPALAALTLVSAPAVVLADEVVTVAPKAFKFDVPADAAALFGHNEDEDKLFFYTNGKAECTVKVLADGEYEIVVRLSCDATPSGKAAFKLHSGGKAGEETKLTADEAKDYTLRVSLKAGEQKLVVEFTNDEYKEGEADRNLYLHKLTLRKAAEKK